MKSDASLTRRGWPRAIAVSIALLALAGCVYAPPPYAYAPTSSAPYAPAPAYYSGYPGYYGGYYAPSVGVAIGGGGRWR